MKHILSVTKNNVIGINNKLAFPIPHDFRWFKMNTYNSSVVMGYNTWKSLKNRPLKNRKNIVVTSKKLTHVKTIANVENIPSNSWIIGGAKLFESVVKKGDIVYLTHVDVTIIDKNNIYVNLPELRLLWETKSFEYKNTKYRFSCYEVV